MTRHIYIYIYQSCYQGLEPQGQGQGLGPQGQGLGPQGQGLGLNAKDFVSLYQFYHNSYKSLKNLCYNRAYY